MKYIKYAICKCKNGTNFGDMITPYIYYKKTGKKAITDNFPKGIDILIGAGSIMGICNSNTVVWGTGIMFADKGFKKPKKILSVRGPLTRNKCLELGYECPEIYGDIGLILPLFYNPKIEKKYKIGIIPHYVDYEDCKRIYGNDYSVIDLTEPVENVIDKILECKMTVSTSLHGIIASHAYNIKCVWSRFSNKIAGGNTKYWDYYKSIGINENIEPININKITDEIFDYPNPSFPIDTRHIIELCPF